ncbi:hypothetical protein CEK25_011307 [Fusarium fujikuroi]|nr:hypothetical protein CEK25_011307 [Fusarium fujikuroi]
MRNKHLGARQDILNLVTIVKDLPDLMELAELNNFLLSFLSAQNTPLATQEEQKPSKRLSPPLYEKKHLHCPSPTSPEQVGALQAARDQLNTVNHRTNQRPRALPACWSCSSSWLPSLGTSRFTLVPNVANEQASPYQAGRELLNKYVIRARSDRELFNRARLAHQAPCILWGPR